jgi:hypothetical protein
MKAERIGLNGKLLQRLMLSRFAGWAKQADTADLPELRRMRNLARQVRIQIDRLLATADNRLALPRIGTATFPKPSGTDWAWRPDLWNRPLSAPGIAAIETKVKFGDEITIFHDYRESELTLRQIRNQRESDLAPYGLRMDVFGFDGSFLSLAVELPTSGAQGLHKQHLLRVEARIECERPLEIFARLNVRHGPNTEQFVRELDLGTGEPMVEFDLAFSKLNEKRVEGMWLDLIFENPEMSHVTIHDLTFCRHPRAGL